MKKNYLITILVVLITILICFIVSLLVLKFTSGSKTPFSKYVKDINNVEIKDNIVIVGYNDKTIINNEKKMYKLLKEKNLLDKVIYINTDDVTLINGSINLIDKYVVKELPAILYFKDGNIKYMIDSRDRNITYNDLAELIDMYNVR